jgi:hypothetical protein
VLLERVIGIPHFVEGEFITETAAPPVRDAEAERRLRAPLPLE